MSNDILFHTDLKAEEYKKRILNTKTEVEISGTAYYVSNNGSDDNDGLTPETPWKTLSKAKDFPYNEGDAILLERGSVFREGMAMRCPHTTLSAYGEGDKPKIYGSPKNFNLVSDWKTTEYENVYLCAEKFEKDVGNIVCNNGEFYGFKQVINNFGFKGEISELKADMEFYHDNETGKLYLYSSGNPAERFSDIEICIGGCVGMIADHLVIDNICTKYCGAHSIASGVPRRGITVQNCEMGWIGGMIQFITDDGRRVRFGNAVEIYVECFDYNVCNNYIYQVYDAGITHQYFQDARRDIFMEDIRYADNLIEYCTYSIEYALACQTDANQHMHNVVIENNIMRYAGYGFGEQRPDKDAAAHIKSWETCNESKNFVIRNNVFDRSDYMLLHIAAFKGKNLPELKGNTYIQIKGGELGRYGHVPTKLYLTDETEEYFENDKEAEVHII